MAFQVSPGINISEIDLSTTTPAVAATVGAIAGVMRWGPVGKFTLVDSENTLVNRYGKPTNNNYETFFSAANFLAYGNSLYVTRAAKTSGYSNTLTTILNSTTSAVIQSTPTVNGLTGTLGVYGPGIPAGTTATFALNGANTNVTLSTAATLTSSQSINFYDVGYTFNAVANSATAQTRVSYLIKNSEHFESVIVPTGVEFVAKYPGDLGNSLKISICDTVAQYSSNVTPYAVVANSTLQTNSTVIPGTSGISIAVNSATANVYVANSVTLPAIGSVYAIAGALKNTLTIGDYILIGNSSIGKQYMKIKAISGVANNDPSTPNTSFFNVTFDNVYKLSTDYVANTINRNWEYYNAIADAPVNSQTVSDAGSSVVDTLSAVVVDEDGKFSGVPGTILEVFQNVSRATDAKNTNGGTNYYKTVINDNSNYVWAVNDLTTGPSALAANVVASTATTPYTVSFAGGTDGPTESTISIGDMATAYDLYSDPNTTDISLIIAGKPLGTNNAQLANYIIDNITDTRKDCVAFVSPPLSTVFGAAADGSQGTNVVNFRNYLRFSSYFFLDTGYKYQYDKYSDTYRYVPLNGDIAGLMVRTAETRDPWFSPAGVNRGQIKNVVKLAWNPSKTDRDLIYKNDINPVVTLPGQGTMLYGDKTGLGKDSAFNRINVRSLFIVLEKTISKAANEMMFEFNDDFTRAHFKNIVEPFLRDVQGRRGIYEFKVICDDSNNTGEVIDAGRFVGDIYIKPAKSINFIQLNFVAVGSSVEFTEIAGQF